MVGSSLSSAMVVTVAALTLAIGLHVCPGRTAEAEPVRLIFDTDICGDCDDVLALGMIHALQSRGLCRLLAVTISVDHELAAPFVDAVNTFYGRGDIPIGVVGKGGVVEKSEFLSLVEEKDGGRFRYPHDLLSGRSAPSATAVLRKTLAAQPDRSVVIAQVGFSTNLARLLDSPADEHSPLAGRSWSKSKVKLLSLMAGAFSRSTATPTIWNTTSSRTSRVPGAGRALAVADGLQRLRDRYRAALPGGQHRARLRLRAASSPRRGLHPPQPAAAQPADLGPDQRAVRGARRPRLLRRFAARHGHRRARRLHAISKRSSQGNHRYLILRPEQKPRVLEALVQLSSQPPVRVEGDK